MNATLAVMKGKTEKFRLERDSNPDLCVTGVVLCQLSHQTNWELVILCEYVTEPVDDMGKEECIKGICYMACVCSRYNARSDWLIVTEL